MNREAMRIFWLLTGLCGSQLSGGMFVLQHLHDLISWRRLEAVKEGDMLRPLYHDREAEQRRTFCELAYKLVFRAARLQWDASSPLLGQTARALYYGSDSTRGDACQFDRPYWEALASYFKAAYIQEFHRENDQYHNHIEGGGTQEIVLMDNRRVEDTIVRYPCVACEPTVYQIVFTDDAQRYERYVQAPGERAKHAISYELICGIGVAKETGDTVFLTARGRGIFGKEMLLYDKQSKSPYRESTACYYSNNDTGYKAYNHPPVYVFTRLFYLQHAKKNYFSPPRPLLLADSQGVMSGGEKELVPSSKPPIVRKNVPVETCPQQHRHTSFSYVGS